MTAVQKKVETIKTSITVAENAHALLQPSVENDKGYCYYTREKEKAIKSGEANVKELESKINTLEARRDAFIDDLEKKKEAFLEEMERKKDAHIKDVDRKIEELERKKDIAREEYERKAEYHGNNALAMAEKLQVSKPTSLAYRKLLSSLEEAEKEFEAVDLEYKNALADMTTASARQAERAAREEQQRLQQLDLEKKLADERALQEIERRRNKEREEEMQRARDRVAASKLAATAVVSSPPQNTPPTQKIVKEVKTSKGVETANKPVEWPLDATKEYTLEYLDSIVVTEEMYSQDPSDIYEDRRSYATYKSRAHGWADSKYARDGVED